MRRLKVAWFNTPTGAVDEALRHLPESEICPPDLYRRLISLKISEDTKIAVVFENGEPIAVSGMIRRARFVWEPLTNWLFPGSAFPVVPGRQLDAMAALGVKVPLAFWRTATPSLEHAAIEGLEIQSTYAMTDLSRRVEFWKSTGYLPTIRKMRERCAHLQIKFGAVEYVPLIIARWHEKWTGQDTEALPVQGRILLANALEPVGKHLTIALLDGDKLVAGATHFVHDGMLVAGVSYLDPKYRSIGAGIRSMDALFDFAENRSLAGFDLGAGADYKQRWAPAYGRRIKFTVANSRAKLLSRCEGAIRRLKRIAIKN